LFRCRLLIIPDFSLRIAWFNGKQVLIVSVYGHKSCLNRKGGAITQLRLEIDLPSLMNYYLNFLLTPTSPTNPEARRSMVEGSGTGAD
jgi:hypothetical protein